MQKDNSYQTNSRKVRTLSAGKRNSNFNFRTLAPKTNQSTGKQFRQP